MSIGHFYNLNMYFNNIFWVSLAAQNRVFFKIALQVFSVLLLSSWRWRNQNKYQFEGYVRRYHRRNTGCEKFEFYFFYLECFKVKNRIFGSVLYRFSLSYFMAFLCHLSRAIIDDNEWGLLLNMSFMLNECIFFSQMLVIEFLSVLSVD